MEALFITAKTGSNQDVLQHINGLVNWYILTMEYCSAKKEIRSHEKTWKKLKCILLSERHQYEKVK